MTKEEVTVEFMNACGKVLEQGSIGSYNMIYSLSTIFAPYAAKIVELESVKAECKAAKDQMWKIGLECESARIRAEDMKELLSKATIDNDRILYILGGKK